MKCERCGHPNATFRITEKGATRRACDACASKAGWKQSKPHQPCIETDAEARVVAGALRKWLSEGDRPQRRCH